MIEVHHLNASRSRRITWLLEELDEYVSLHVTQFLIEAKDRGQAVPDDMLRSATGFVAHIVAKPAKI